MPVNVMATISPTDKKRLDEYLKDLNDTKPPLTDDRKIEGLRDLGGRMPGLTPGQLDEYIKRNV